MPKCRRRALVVDNEPWFVASIRAACPGWTVDSATTLEHALSLLRHAQYESILFDLIWGDPTVDGILETVMEIKRKYPDSRVTITTDHPLHVERIRKGGKINVLYKGDRRFYRQLIRAVTG